MERGWLTLTGSTVLCSWAFVSSSCLTHLTNDRMRITIPIFRDGKMKAQRRLAQGHRATRPESELQTSLASKLKPSWPSMNLFSCFSVSVSETPAFHNNLLSHGLPVFSQVAALISPGLVSEEADITPRLCLALKELSCVGGWSLTERDLWKGTGFPQWPQMRPASPPFSQWFLKRVKQHVLKVGKSKYNTTLRPDFFNITI